MTKDYLSRLSLLCQTSLENISCFKVYFHAHSMQKSPYTHLKNKTLLLKASYIPDLLCAE